MKTKSLLAMAVAPMILGMPLATMAESVTTDPVGFVKTTLPTGLSAVSINLVLPAVAAGTAQALTSNSVTVGESVDLNVALTAGGQYYMEVTGGALQGDRIDVDVAATLASGATTLNLDLSAPHNTLATADGLPSDTTFVIRPHITFATITAVLGAGNIFSGTDIPDTDQILTYDGGFVVHGYFDGVWYDGAFDVVDNKVIAPGAGFLFRRQAPAALDMTVLGEVRSNDFVLPLGVGLQLVSFGFPVDSSPADLSMTPEFFTAAVSDFSEGDQILTWDGSFVLHGLFNDGEWYDGDFTPVTSSKLFAADGAVLVKMNSADPDFRVVKPY